MHFEAKTFSSHPYIVSYNWAKEASPTSPGGIRSIEISHDMSGPNSIPRKLSIENSTGYFTHYIEIVREICNWASEASPTLGCSIEISRDIYIYTIVTMEIAM